MYIWAFISKSFFNIQGIVTRFYHIYMEKARYKFLIIITINYWLYTAAHVSH